MPQDGCAHTNTTIIDREEGRRNRRCGAVVAASPALVISLNVHACKQSKAGRKNLQQLPKKEEQ
eukprot:34893-Eustigmatos_ZCMA.PRE.1